MRLRGHGPEHQQKAAGDRPNEAGKPGHLQGRDAAQHDLLRHHGDRVDGGAQQHQENAGEVGLVLVAKPIRVPANATRPPMTSIRGKPSPRRSRRVCR